MAPANRTESDKSEKRIARYRRCELSSPFFRLEELIIVVATAAPPVRSATPRSTSSATGLQFLALVSANCIRDSSDKAAILYLLAHACEHIVATEREHLSGLDHSSAAQTHAHRQLQRRHGRPQPRRSQQSRQHAEHHTDRHFVAWAGVGGVVLFVAVTTEDEI